MFYDRKFDKIFRCHFFLKVKFDFFSNSALIGVWLALRNAHLEHEKMERAVFRILDEDRLDLSKVARDNLERLLSIAVALSSGPLARVRISWFRFCFLFWNFIMSY